MGCFSLFLDKLPNGNYYVAMNRDTKREILDEALFLFSTNGYGDTSMSDISSRLNLTKAALYKHFSSKEEILETIIREMDEEDIGRAEELSVPLSEDGKRVGGTEKEDFASFALSQFSYWTEDIRALHYRRLLSLERFKNPRLMEKWNGNFVSGPMDYTEKVLFEMGYQDAKEKAFLLWGAMFLSYALFDGGEEKESVKRRLKDEIWKILEVWR